MSMNKIDKNIFNQIYMRIMFLEGENCKNKKFDDKAMVNFIIKTLDNILKGEKM